MSRRESGRGSGREDLGLREILGEVLGERIWAMSYFQFPNDVGLDELLS